MTKTVNKWQQFGYTAHQNSNQRMESRPLVIDNGSFEVKFGYHGIEKPYRALNALAKDKYGTTYLSNQIRSIKDISNVVFRRPHELGQLVSWEVQQCIWDYCLYNPDEFHGLDLGETTRDTHLVTNETCLTLPVLSRNMDQVIFEEYEFASLYKAPSAAYIPFYKRNSHQGELVLSGKDEAHVTVIPDKEEDGRGNVYNDFQMVIDSGYNCTWVIPVIRGIPYYKGVKKLDIGGRFLNGLLKESLSFRHYNMMDETILVNNIKEQCLYTSPMSYYDSFKNSSMNAMTYMLPDFQTSFMGYVYDKKKMGKLPENSQSIILTDERFAIPESFFHPEIANLLKPGIIETILESISMLPEALRPIMVSNIFCTGGNFNIPNLATRLVDELQGQLPTEWNCRLTTAAKDNELINWRAMAQFSETELYKGARVTREEYLEHGVEWTTKQRFGYENWI